MTPNEALKRIRQETCPATYMQDFDKEECCKIIENALLELKAIKEAKPSEALKLLLDIENNYKFYVHNKQDIQYQCAIIKATLLKAQEQEKENQELKQVVEIIKNKRVDIKWLIFSDTKECYNAGEGKLDRELTEQEFDLLKRWLG